MTLDGYPGLERFYLPAAGLTCVLAGVGVVWLASLASEAVAGARRRRRPAGGGGGRAPLVGVGVAVAAGCARDPVHHQPDRPRAGTELDRAAGRDQT